MKLSQDIYNFRTFRVYLYYRLILGCVLYLMYETGLTQSALGSLQPDLFRWTALGYTILTIGSLYFLKDKSLSRSNAKIEFLLACDLIAIIMLIHASGGLASGLGYLLVITSAIASMFLRRQLSLGFAALISFFLIAETIYISREDNLVRPLFGAGTLGFLVFITALTFQYLTERIRSSTEEAAQQSEYAKQLVQLAQHIVARMRTGIAVIDKNNKIELINESALQLLDLPQDKSYLGRNISELSNLEHIIQRWRTSPNSGIPHVHTLNRGHEVRINFANLDEENGDKTILYIEDYRALMQQAQQLKLASLGRLTASIAHEIRNPLGAISHAAQLLSESESVDPTDLRFTEIIVRHSDRVNQIIENTMSLSKRKEPKAQLLELNEWIPAFIEDYSTTQAGEIHYSCEGMEPKIKMDPTHLGQVMTNLFDNGLRYSLLATGKASIKVASGLSVNDETTYIEIVDFGDGVPKEKTQQIFEPFFTTGEQGTGLGLYISRELCEINQATLKYQTTTTGNSCFRINFPHYQRMI